MKEDAKKHDDSIESLPVASVDPVEKTLPPVFVDDVKEKDTRKEEDVKEKDDKKEDATKVEDVIFESLPDRSSEVMEADFDPDPPALCPLWNLLHMARMGLWAPSRNSLESSLGHFCLTQVFACLLVMLLTLIQLAQGLCHLHHLILCHLDLAFVPASRAKSRAPRRSRGRTEERSRSRASPERRILDGKARVTTVSGSGAGGLVARPLPAPLPWMPGDTSLPYIRDDFLRWTALSLASLGPSRQERWLRMRLCKNPGCVGTATNQQDPTPTQRQPGNRKMP